MDIVRFSIEKPVTVIVGVILVVLFGWIGLQNMPYQLSPTVVEPEITVTTTWTGATPYEMERDIIEEQEKVLKGIPGLTEMESECFNNYGTVTLRFRIGTDVNEALLRVSNKLDEVPSYPDNVDKPIINATGSATSPVIWMVFQTLEDNPNSINTYRTYFENEIRQYLERVEGVADLMIVGGTEKEMHIVVSPEKLAAYGLTIQDLIRILKAENANVSAGSMGVGRREYRIRTVAEFKSPEEIKQVVLKSTGERRITVSDVADVHFGYAKFTDAMLHNGKEGTIVGIKPEPGANVLELTGKVEEVVKWLNQEKLRPQKVFLNWVYDQRPYINGAIDLVKENILIGGILAVVVLLIFLRSISSTIVVSTAIPISVIGTFLFMNALGRNLNVISLAGISFAVGMLVDNAIVVLENIDRHRKMGKSSFQASYDGTQEVWGAVVASTLTTVAVFLPVVFIQEEAGQLFKDIAIAVTCAVSLSLLVSISVIPTLSGKLFSLTGKRLTLLNGKGSSAKQNSPSDEPATRFSVGSLFGKIGDVLLGLIMKMVGLAQINWVTRLATIVLLTALSVLSTLLLFPKMEYLPQGNRNLVLSILVPPPGLSYKERKEIGEHIYQSTKDHFNEDRDGIPGIKTMFYLGAERIMLFGTISMHEQRAGKMVPLFMKTIQSIPGMFGISKQAGIFETRLGRGRAIDIDISAGDLNRVVQAAGTMFGMMRKELPDAQVRPIPSLELLYPEVRIIPLRDKLKAVGLNADDLGMIVDVLMDGRKMGDFKQPGEKKIDLILKASEKEITTPEELYTSLVVTPPLDLKSEKIMRTASELQGAFLSGPQNVLPLYSLADIDRTTGITQVRHLERQRTVTLQVTPPERMPLQETMEFIENKIIPPLKSQGVLDGMDIRMSGAADKLTETRKALQWNFILAMVITYLLMSALFGNFIYPFIIMFTVPLAAAGGFIGLKLVNLFIAPQSLDVLTMLGFIILIGVVVNNAILIVYQSLNNVRDYGMDYHNAVLDSVKTRLRPIYMSTTTSIFGMLPLVVAPGPGSELYRGLGSVVLGGLAFSTLFTIFVIPALLLFFIRMEKIPEVRDSEQSVEWVQRKAGRLKAEG